MLSQALLDRDIYGQSRKASRKSLYSRKEWVDRLDLTYELKGHRGCVNTLSWSQEGEWLLSGSDDHRLYIWSANDNFSIRKVLDTGHMGNIFSAKFMPHTNNSKIISCAGDRLIKLSEVEYTPGRLCPGSTKRTWHCHSDMTKRIVTEGNPNTFLSCSEDGDVRHHDLRISHPCPSTANRNCPPPLISYQPYHIELTTLTMTRANPMYLIVGGSHPHAFLHDRRMIGRDMQREWGTLNYRSDAPTQCVRRFAPNAMPTTRRSIHITACKFSEARPDEFVGSWSADKVYMFNIHDSPATPRESNLRSKSAQKANPAESSSSGKRKRSTSKRGGEEDEEGPGEGASTGSSLDVGRQPPPLRESSVSAETTTESLAAMSSITVAPESVISNVAPDALGRQLTVIRRLFFTPTEQCTQQTFLMAHESVVNLLGEMRLAMYSGAPSLAPQREESIRFVTAIGVATRVIALRLDWPTPVEEALLAPIRRNWDHWIRRTWDGWVIQFIRLVTGWFDDIIAPNNIIRELTLNRADAPDVPLVAVGGESVLFDTLADMSSQFEAFVLSPEKSMEDKRLWGLVVLRALILLLGDGLNFAFIEGAFCADIDEEDPEALLEALEAAELAEAEDDDNDEEDDEEEDEEGENTLFSYDGIDFEDQEEDDQEEEEENIPLFYFPSRRSGLSYPERNASKDVPIVSHRRAYSGHCNVQTIKDVNYYGLDDEYVMSGSDDGVLFIWDEKKTGIVQLLNADHSVTNVMTGHPYHPLLAASGIDHTVKVFSPEGLGPDLTTRQVLKDEYRIRSRNEAIRQSGMTRAFLTRDMLEALAFNLRARRARGEGTEPPEGCETM